MPKLLQARAPLDETEERRIRKLAASRHAPSDVTSRAKTIRLSWDGWRTSSIAQELGCHQQTVRERIERFNRDGFDSLSDRHRSGRKPRLSETERSTIIALVQTSPPAQPQPSSNVQAEVQEQESQHFWSLDALALAAQARGIRVARSQIRRILIREGVRWRQVRSWSTSSDEEFVPKGIRSSDFTPHHH